MQHFSKNSNSIINEFHTHWDICLKFVYLNKRKTSVPEITKFRGKHLCSSHHYLQMCFTVKFVKFFRVAFLQNTSRQLFLNILKRDSAIENLQRMVQNFQSNHFQEHFWIVVLRIFNIILFWKITDNAKGRLDLWILAQYTFLYFVRKRSSVAALKFLEPRGFLVVKVK